MSSLGIVDFIANNHLDEVGATPVWEKFRKHFYAVGVGISLFALYFTLGIRVECAPAYSNRTVVTTDLKSTHVNEYCGNNDQLIVFRYSGCMLVGMNAVILLAASYWLYLPNVIEPLRTFSKIRGLVNDINLPWEELKQLMATPMTAEELSKTDTPTEKLLKQKKIRELIILLPSLKDENDQQRGNNDSVRCCNRNCLPCANTNALETMHFSPDPTEEQLDSGECTECRPRSLIAWVLNRPMSTSYIFRNVLLGIIFIIFILGLITLTILMIRTGYTFSCPYDLTTDREYYICTVGGISVAIVCNMVYALAICCQLVAIVHGYKRAKNVVENENGRGETAINYSSIRLIARFCESSQSSHSGDLSNLINFLFSGDFRSDVANNAYITGTTTDVELRDICRVFYKGPLRKLTSSQREYDGRSFEREICVTKYKLGDCIELAELLVKHELWMMFVTLLGNAVDLNTPSQEDVYDFSKLMICFDSLASKDQEVKKLANGFYETRSCIGSCESHSILYYPIIMGYTVNVDVACFLLSCFKQIKPYVHYCDGTGLHSVPALEYLESQPLITTIEGYPRLKSEIEECNIPPPNPEYKCQKVLRDTLKVYKEKAQYNENIRDIVAKLLPRRRFRVWDETAFDFFELAAKEEHHEIEFALLKAFFTGNPLQYLCRQHHKEKKCIPSDACIYKIITDFVYELEDCKYLVAHLAEIHSWTLLVGLLSNTITRCDETSPEQNDFFRTLKIDLQVTEISMPFLVFCEHNYAEIQVNIVKAALEPVLERDRDCARFSVANFLLLVSEPQILYVMGKGLNKKRLSEYLRNSDTRDTKKDYKKFKDALAEFELRYLFSSYQNNSKNEEFKEILADVPIREWNDQVHKFAELASTNEDWGIVISLLNTHIVENNIQEPFNIDLNNVSDIWGLIRDSRPTTPDDVCGIIREYFRLRLN